MAGHISTMVKGATKAISSRNLLKEMQPDHQNAGTHYIMNGSNTPTLVLGARHVDEKLVSITITNSLTLELTPHTQLTTPKGLVYAKDLVEGDSVNAYTCSCGLTSFLAVTSTSDTVNSGAIKFTTTEHTYQLASGIIITEDKNV